MPPQSTCKMVPFFASDADGRAIQIFLRESCARPFIWLIASSTVSFPVIGKRFTLSPLPVLSTTT